MGRLIHRGTGVVWITVMAVMILTAACGTRRVSLEYQTPGQPLPPLKQLVAVGHFADNRGEPANWLGAIRGGYGNPLKNLETAEPVSEVVANSFAAGLKQRGLYAGGSGGVYLLSGSIKRLNCNQYVRREASAELEVVLTERATGRQVFSKNYEATNVEGSILSVKTGIFASTEDLRLLTERTLRQTVDSALDDPALSDVFAHARDS